MEGQGKGKEGLSGGDWQVGISATHVAMGTLHNAEKEDMTLPF